MAAVLAVGRFALHSFCLTVPLWSIQAHFLHICSSLTVTHTLACHQTTVVRASVVGLIDSLLAPSVGSTAGGGTFINLLSWALSFIQVFPFTIIYWSFKQCYRACDKQCMSIVVCVYVNVLNWPSVFFFSFYMKSERTLVDFLFVSFLI